MAQIKNANSHPLKTVLVDDTGRYANSHPFKVTIEGGADFATKEELEELGRKVEALEADLTWKDPVEDYAHLPQAGNSDGDVRLTRDTGILYVWATDEWVPLNESTIYTAGSGLNLSNNEFSVDTDTIQPKLTAGENITIDGNVISAEGGISANTTFWGQSYDSENNKVSGAMVNVPYIRNTDSSSITQYSTVVLENGEVGVRIAGTTLTEDNYTPIRASRNYVRFRAPIRMQGNKIESVADPTQAQDVATKNYTDNLTISYAALNGTAAPTTATEGKYVGQLYFDTTNDKKYYLKAIDTTTDPDTYTWEEFGGGIPTNAIFWGASYDSTNNKVDGQITSTSTTSSNILRLNTSNTAYGQIIEIGLAGGYASAMAVQAFSGDGSQAQLRVDSTNNGQGQIACMGVQTVLLSEIPSQTVRVSSVATPTSPTDATNKHYVDTAVASATVSAFPATLFNEILEEA